MTHPYEGLSVIGNVLVPFSLPSDPLGRRLTAWVRNEIARRGFPAGPADPGLAVLS